MVRKNHLLLVLLFCANLFCIMPGSFISRAESTESGSFTGSWVATGSEETLAFGAGREAALFRLSGHVNLHDQIGGESDYWAECIGLADSETGSDVRCVWKSLDGVEIYLTLKGKRLVEGSSVSGEIVGGTKAAEGISGSIQFTWSSMAIQSSNDKTSIGGYAKDLSGNYRLP